MPRLRPRSTIAGALAGTAALAFALTGCVPNNPGGGSAGTTGAAIPVTLHDEKNTVGTATARSGPVTFQVTNKGTDVNEFEVLASDKLRIAGEKDNIGPGTTVNYVVQLTEGRYFTACKKGMVGSPTSLAAFSVTKGSGDAKAAGETKQIQQAVTNYTGYVKDQAGQLLSATQTFAAAYEAGDDTAARAQYPAARQHYERIEPTAEQFGDIDPALDLREADLEQGQSWTGWHRIEKDLWAPAGHVPSNAADRKRLGDRLVSDTQRLYDLVYAKGFSLTLDQISNGASSLMEEVAGSKITGEEETFSHSDLWDFAANVEGAQVAYETVRDVLVEKGDAGKAMAKKLDAEFAAIGKLLSRYASGEGYASYTQLSTAQVKELSDKVNALSEPLSQLTSILVKSRR
ncbi:lipoprotein [Leifsonia xyli subsp. xyli str. CTCB07]|uniref:Lipoprotein n=1 Tax=Leifsonia xyli subsp. xyli (strain CTCB07) TaxID=281090 RepID=Q6ADY0_LEIXX|nr:iron uptake system protein EfeO [Leifsonia xyli]AAT89416.1 lipoprotein [Leifsonia xyli subsp. xyli str. CTCB07]